MARPASPDAAAPDRPWKRPGAARYAAARLRGFLRSPADVYPPAPGSVMIENDVPITTRDGTVLRTNVYRPTGAGPFPVLLCAHPYGKDNLPEKKRGRGYSVSQQYRVLRQPPSLRFSSLTGWEAPDPAWWTAHGLRAARLKYTLDEDNTKRPLRNEWWRSLTSTLTALRSGASTGRAPSAAARPGRAGRHPTGAVGVAVRGRRAAAPRRRRSVVVAA
jgi:predicted acyl esterase